MEMNAEKIARYDSRFGMTEAELFIRILDAAEHGYVVQAYEWRNALMGKPLGIYIDIAVSIGGVLLFLWLMEVVKGRPEKVHRCTRQNRCH